MKRILLTVACIILAAGVCFAQQLTTAVSPFEISGGFTQDEADVITELFTGQLAATNKIKVVDRNSFDKIAGEMKFQLGDWSDSRKVAQLGTALNVDSIIRGQLMKLGNKLVITTRIVDVKTTEILSSSSVQLNSIDEVFNRLPTLAAEVAKNLPEPPPPPPKNYFVGRWQAVCNASVFPEDQYSLVCIMDIKENGTIVVERYDTGSVTIKSRMIGKNARTYTPLRTGSGTGTWFMKYTDKDSQTISVSLSLKNVPGAVSSINASATLHISDTTRMEFSRYDLNCVWRSDSQIWGYDYFSRIR